MKKTIPTSFEQCTRVGEVPNALENWAANLRKYGRICFVFLLFASIIGTIVLCIMATDGAYYDNETDGMINAVASGISTLIFAFIVLFSAHAIALLLEALANIVYNTSVSANIALYEHRDEVPTEKEEETTSSDTSKSENSPFWNCPYCGKQNYYFHTTCFSCGTPNNKKTESAPKITVPDSENATLCPSCGKTNIKSNDKCWNCGTNL